MVDIKRYYWLIGAGIVTAGVSISVALYFTLGVSDVEDHCTNEITSSCEISKGRCVSTESTWRCDCKPGYGNPGKDTKRCEDLPCGRHTALSAEEGEFEIPDTNFSDTYPNRMDCTWDIKTTVGKALVLIFTKFSLEYSKSCQNDYLRLIEQSRQGSLIEETFCGSEKPGEDGVYIAKSNSVRLQFHSNFDFAEKGVKLTWSSVENPCTSGDTPTCPTDKGYCVSKLDWKCICYPGFHHPSGDTKTCDGVECGIRNQISAEEGKLEYPGGDSNLYEKEKNCTWTLTTTPGKVLTLTFTEFHLEKHSKCKFDHIEVNNGSIQGPAILDRLCGSKLPGDNGVYTTTLNKIRLVFYSDHFGSYPGFKLTWTSD